jgi:hypothetical protein
LSLPSEQLISESLGQPQSVGQLQEVSATSQDALPQHVERQAESAQSAVPLQSLSRPSVQIVSVGGSVPQSCGQVPAQRSDGVQLPLPQVLPKLQEIPRTLEQL